ncbi:MAG TPA: hypothetical protein PLM07_03385 [Candidatus Rifleibacterium sp.]|nr:hypothetical protein [Candidatus Rifleibacterium sp.]HPT44926.1 hypothetical protein [Candidatus Rifleibacterium sp.]
MIQCKPLIPLQELDLKIDAAKAQIEEKKQKILRMQNEIDADAQLIEKKLALLKKIQLRRRKAESEVNELNQQITYGELKMQSAGMAPATYKALEKEQNARRAKISIEESKILEDMEKIEMLEKDTAKGQKVVAGRRDHLVLVKTRVSEEITGIRKEIDLIQTERSQVSLKIAADLLEKYEELRQRKKGQVIFAIETPSCPACGMGLPGGFLGSITSHEDSEPCSNCGVLLHWTGQRV